MGKLVSEIKTCSECGVDKVLDEFYYVKSTSRHKARCKECDKRKSTEYQKSGYREKEKYVFYQRAYLITKSCKGKTSNTQRHGLEVMDKLKEHITMLWNQQNKKCYYTGMDMVLTGSQKGIKNAFTVDRIDSSKGYIEGNIVLCTDIANRMKQNLTISELYDMCKLIEENIEKHLDIK